MCTLMQLARVEVMRMCDETKKAERPALLKGPGENTDMKQVSTMAYMCAFAITVLHEQYMCLGMQTLYDTVTLSLFIFF